MAEQIKIAELNIDTQKLKQSLVETKQEIDELTQSQREMKKQGDTSSETFIKQEAELKKLRKEYNSKIKVLQASTDVEERLGTAMNTSAKSIDGLRESNKELLAIRNQLDLSTEEGVAQLAAINAKIDENNATIKENVSAYEEQKIGIGDYTKSIQDSLGITKAKEAAIKAKTAVMGVYSMVVGKSTGALKLFRIALASTGIGLVVIALGSLVAYLTQTQEGINKVNRFLAPMREIFQALIGIVQNLGKQLFTAFSEPRKLLTDLVEFVKSSVIGTLRGLGNVIMGIVNRDLSQMKDGLKEAFDAQPIVRAGKAVGEMGKEIRETLSEAAERGREMQEVMERLQRTEAEFIITQAELNREYQEQRKASDDVNLSLEERAQAAERALNIQQELADNAIARLEDEIHLMELQHEANDTSYEEEVELANLRARLHQERQRQAQQSRNAQRAHQRLVQEIASEEVKAQQKAIDENLKRMKQEIDLFKARQGLQERSTEEELALAEQLSEKRLAILEKEFEAGKMSQIEYETARLNITNEFAQKQAQAIQAAAEQELERERERLEEEEQRRLEREDFLREQELAEAEDRFERRQIQLERQYQAEIETAERLGFDTTAIEERYAAMSQEIERQKQMAKIGMAIQSLDTAVQVLGTESMAGKQFAVFQALLHTYQGIAAGVRLGWPAMIPAVALATKTGFGAVRNLISTQQPSQPGRITKPRFRQGGILRGRRHAQGGIPIEAEDGEAIINRRSTGMFQGILSRINQIGGGTSFGPSSAGANQQLIDYDLLAARVADANRSLPSPILGIREFTETDTRVTRIQERAEF